MRSLTVHGAGPAGSMAAIAALKDGIAVELFDKSRFPRHKVCGEFLSPEIAQLLDVVGVLNQFHSARPARINSLTVQIGRRRLTDRLPEPAYGLSRFALDQLLLTEAQRRGAVFSRQAAPEPRAPCVLALGRNATDSAEKGNRLFGFKAHYSGPATDAVELYFFNGCYVGLNAVENGITNVCGLGPQRLLKECGFQIDEILNQSSPLKERLAPLKREWDWLSVGPLVFGNRLRSAGQEGIYPTGDLLSFVDPFTGSGLFSALLTGRLAGVAASEGWELSRYLGECERALLRPYRFSSFIRWAVQREWAEVLGQFVPGRILFRLTRPRLTR